MAKFGQHEYVSVARYPFACGTVADTWVHNGQRFYVVSWHGAPYASTIERESDLQLASDEQIARYQ
ncbi:hypothetical protein SEABISCUIT_94 [Mycobacterium phage Seabiscuit]|uniref:hypothetical protein n=1 Tax=Mycobacterium phage Seabiscuit TaxID=1458714 RepID=UPI00043ADF8E|nr:hypothetical protein SEABISCUIT_94 [Mycobacterium phage Seabiscuit]AHN84410.1 hypothetical protein SEABISCUIT_94 [Mycobacterium phage Seabiscuit]